MCAVWNDSHVTVHPSHDVWALGVIAYEAITQQRALTTHTHIAQYAQGQALYPWEADASQQPHAWLQSRLRTMVEACLQREPGARPSAAQIHAKVSRMGQITSLHQR
jgi:serine/threonine protein kinase